MSGYDPDGQKWNLKDMMAAAAQQLAPPTMDEDDDYQLAAEAPCLYCQRHMGCCECIPGEKSILLDDENYIVVDAEFEPV